MRALEAGRNKQMPPFLPRYIKTAAAYGVLHSVMALWDRQGAYRDSRTGADVPPQLLLSDKLALGAGLTGAALVYWPVMLHYDLTRAEVALRRSPPHYALPHFMLDAEPQ